MSKTRSRPAADDARSTRRSPVEQEGTATSRVADEGSAGRPAASAEQPSRSEASEAPLLRSVDLSAADSAADMLVKIAKEYQSGILDSVRFGLNAALDHARNLAETPREAKDGLKSESAAGHLPPEFDKAAAAFRAETLDLMQANLAASLGYARELAGAKSAADLAEISGSQARKQCELMLKQAGALKSLAARVSKPGSGEA